MANGRAMIPRVCLLLPPDVPADIHLLRAAVVAWAVARSGGGDLVVRVEPRGDAPAMAALSWLGVDPDEGPEPDPETAGEPFTHVLPLAGANARLPGDPARIELPPLVSSDGPLPDRLPWRYTAEGLSTMGYLPAAVFNFLVLLDWTPPGGREVLNRWDVRQHFRAEELSTEPAVFEWARLDTINRAYLDALSTEALAALVAPYLEDAYEISPAPDAWLLRLTAVIRVRMVKLEDAADLAEWAFSSRALRNAAAAEALRGPLAHPILARLAAELATIVLLDEPTAAAILSALRRDFDPAEVERVVTAALLGEVDAWPLAEVMALLGKERTLVRVGAAF